MVSLPGLVIGGAFLLLGLAVAAVGLAAAWQWTKLARHGVVDPGHGELDLRITTISYGDTHRFREQRVHEGETVSVAGVADRQVGDYDVGFGGPDAVIRAPPNQGRFDRFLRYPFVVSDRSEKAAEGQLLKRALIPLAIGVPVAVLAALLVVAP